MNVTLKQLRAFTAIAHERSFTRASQALHVTQSTLTSTIKTLEAEIGLRLFDRSTRSCELTAQGARFLPAAERMLRDLDQSVDEIRQVVGLQRGSVAVAAAASFINLVLAQAVVDMARGYPAIAVRLVEEITSGVCRLVNEGSVDFGITSLYEPVPDLEAKLILVDNYGLVCSASHPLAAHRGPVTWAELAPHTMVSLQKSSGIRANIELHARVPARCKQPLYEVGSMSSLHPLLDRGLGYAALPRLAAQTLVAAGLVFLPLSKPVVRRHLYIVTKRGRSLSPSAELLLTTMAGALRNMPVPREVSVRLV